MAITWKSEGIKHAGFVLRFDSRDERIMSDVYALVRYAICIDPTTGAEVSVRLGDCEFGNHSDLISAEIDATPEALALHCMWIDRCVEEQRIAFEKNARARRLADIKRVAKGKRCVVARGRKVAKGTTGVCIWVGDGHYGERCGIKDEAGTVHWTASKNVDVILSEEEANAA